MCKGGQISAPYVSFNLKNAACDVATNWNLVKIYIKMTTLWVRIVIGLCSSNSTGIVSF